MKGLVKQIVLLLFVLLGLFSHTVSAASVPFNEGVFAHIKKEHQGEQWLMVLWSVDCPACFKELAFIKDLRQQKPNINVIIVNTDGEEEANLESDAIMKKFKLADTTTYFFEEGSADRNRYLIDPSWYGELPRSYFVDSNGLFHGRSGLVDPSIIKKWLL